MLMNPLSRGMLPVPEVVLIPVGQEVNKGMLLPDRVEASR